MKKLLRLIKKHHIFIPLKLMKRTANSFRVLVFLNILPGSRPKAILGLRPKVIGMKNITLSGGFSFGDYLWLETISEYHGTLYSPKIEIGDNFSASDFVHIACTNKLSIGKNVLIGSKVHITDHSHGIYSGDMQSSPFTPPIMRTLPGNGFITIGDNVWIGDNVVILPNTSIGSGSIIGANSIVSKDIPDNSIAVGAPAKVIKQWNDLKKTWTASYKPTQQN